MVVLKNLVLRKFYAENEKELFPSNSSMNPGMKYFQSPSPLESQCIPTTYETPSLPFLDMRSPSSHLQNDSGVRRKDHYFNDLQQDNYLKGEEFDYGRAHLESPNQLGNQSFNNNDFIPHLDSLKLGDSIDQYPQYSQPQFYIKNEPSDQSEGTLYHDSDRSLNSEYSSDPMSSTTSPYHDLMAPHDQSLFMGMNPDYNICSSPLDPYSREYAQNDDTFKYDDQPLDLSVAKEEEPQFHSMDQDYFANGSDFAAKEGSEENAWLKKIKTGTRSRVRSPKSWEFLLRLLMDSQSNPSMIKWEDMPSGTFRLVQKDKIAKIWGMRSNKHKDGGLSYDNFARNLRYHYKTKMLIPVSEKHLVYRFSEEVMKRRHSIVNQS